MNFISVDSKITIEGNKISKKRILRHNFPKVIVSAFIIIWGINLFTERLNDSLATGNRWLSVYIIGFVMLLFLSQALYTVFFKFWSNQFDVSMIKKIIVDQGEEGIETNVIIYMKNGRSKEIKFRTLEKQYENFLETIKMKRPEIMISNG